MSRQRCLSLDRAQRKQQKENILHYGGYVPERSPNRKPLGAGIAVPQHVPSLPEINRRNYGGGLEDIGEGRIQCLPLDDDEYYAQRLYAENLPEEFLDDFEAPSFHDLPPNASFDEVMCVMATPPPAPRQSVPTAAEKLDAFRAEVAEVIELDDLRKRMAAHIGTSGQEQQTESVQVDDVRRRMAALIGESAQEPKLCPYKIPPLPEDPYAIPPHPKDPKDIVGIIRRAHAIARLKALEESKVAKKVPKVAAKKGVRGVTASLKLPRKPIRSTNLPKMAAKRNAGAVTKHPPDYVPDEWAAAILRARKLAGLRTRNPKLLPKPKTPPALVSKSPLPQTLPQHPSTPTPSNFANIMERVAAMRSKTDTAKSALLDQKKHVLTPTPQDELDEFEALEQIYGATMSDQYPVLHDSVSNLQNRINALQQELLQTPPSLDASHMPQDEELNEFEALEQLYGAPSYDQCPVREDIETDLQDRINTLQQNLFRSPVKADVAKQGSPRATPKVITPKRSRSPAAAAQTCPSGFNDELLQNIDVPDFDLNDLPDFAFSAEALADAGFVIGDEDSLGEISMPTFEDDISFDELGLEDVTSPELCDLSISGADMDLEPDYTLETATEEEEDEIAEQIVNDQRQKSVGFLTTVVNAVVDRFRNIFSPLGSNVAQQDEEEGELNLDSSLPNMFETTPTPKTKTPPPKELEVQHVIEKALTLNGPIRIPPHPKDPKDYIAIVKRAQAIQKKKEQEAAMAPVPAPTSKEIKGKRERGPPPRKKSQKPKKVYPPGEYSPSYARAVAKARSLAGFKNRSALLNPERAAKIAELKAAREAELAAIEALPPVERMRKKMESRSKRLGATLPRPSIEALGALEAIRANLPMPKPSKRKWRPTGRLRADRRVKPDARVFTRDFGRVLIPTKLTQGKKKGWRKIDVMSPIVEEEKYRDEDFMEFSPLKPHEGQMRLRYLKEQFAKRAAEINRAAEEAQAAISFQTPSTYRTHSPSSTPQMSTPQFSPIKLQSPNSPRTEQSKREKVTTRIGPNGGEMTIREEVTERSTIENGEVHTSTRHVTTKTDEFGNVTCHIQKGKGLSGEEETFQEDLSEIEPPDFFDTSDIPPPSDPAIPTPAEIIERIRSKVQQKLNIALPNIPRSPRSPSPASPGMIDFPQNLPDEELFDIETPDFERTPQKASPHIRTVSPIEKDQRMYAWGEIPPLTPQPRMHTPKVLHPSPMKYISPLDLPKPRSPEGIICIPPHPKDPRDYKAMVKRAQAIEKLKKQQNELAAKAALPVQPIGKIGRVPISRWVGPPPRDPKRPPRKRIVLKKRVLKVSPKTKIVQQPEDDDSEPPPLTQEYRDAVARARLIHGLKNRTAALNPAVAAKKAAEEAAQAAFDALPAHAKIKERMKAVRKIPAQKRRIEPSSDILGTIAAIRANMPPIEEVLRQPSPYRSPIEEPVVTQTTSPKTPTNAYSTVNIPQAPMRVRPRSISPSPIVDKSLDEFEFLEKYMDAMPEDQQLQGTLLQRIPSSGNSRMPSPDIAPICLPENLSLEEFEHLEAELKYDSLDEFEALEAEAQILYNYDTPKRGERHLGRMLAHQFSQSILGRATLQHPFVTPTADAEPCSIYYDEFEDFRVPVEDIVLETSQLMPQTPPKNLQERFQRLKEAHERRTSPSRYTQEFDVSPVTPAAHFSPIKLISPSSDTCVVPEQNAKQIFPVPQSVENECLVNIDETSEQRVAAVKQFRDLEDMPFDELEYEIEPSLTNISFEKPMSPPPRPSDIISRIRSRFQQQLQECERHSIPKTPETLQMPEELTDEELFELSAPSFARTPPRTPPSEYKSPRVSLPMAWGEVRPVTPVTPQRRISTPIKQQSPSCPTEAEIGEEPLSPKVPIVIPPHPKNPKDYAAIVRRAQAIYKLKKQEEAEEAARAPPPEPPKKNGRVPISRWQGPPPKKVSAKPKRKLVFKKRVPQPTKSMPEVPQALSLEYEEPPQLSQEYRDAVARARLIHGLKNKTAALNPKIAAKIAAKKAAEEAAAAAYNALSEHEKIKVRMERLRRKPLRGRGYKPTMEQIAYLEALKQMEEYQYSNTLPTITSTTSIRVSITPRGKASTYQQQRLSITPRAASRKITQAESSELAEFEALEQFEEAYVCPSSSSIQDNAALKQRIADLEEQLLEAEGVSQVEDESLAEFEALEALEAPFDQCPTQPVTTLDMNQRISELQQQQLVTPTRVDPRERYRQLIAQRKTPPKTPVLSPVKTPEIRYSPITLPSSSSKEEPRKRAEKSTTQITRSGNNTIKEQVYETSEMVNGELQHFTNHVTTTTDHQGNVTCQINESKRIAAIDRSGEIETSEDLGDIQEPSFLETTPLTPMERPRPRDIIERVRRQVKESYRPEVPTGHLVELRTPPRMLPLPEEVPEEELLDLSYPSFERTLTRTPVSSPSRSPVRLPDVSIPQLFAATPPPPTPPLPPVSPLRHRIPSPEGPIIIPSHPKDPTDFKTMCRRARKIQQLIKQNEAEVRAAKEAEAAAAAMAAAEAAKPKKKERVPISRWTAPPPKKTKTRKKLIMKKRGDIMTTKTPEKPPKVEYSEEPPPIPEHYAQEVALARRLAGLKNRTAALNPKVAAREAANAEAIRKAQEAEAAKLALLNATPPSPIRDYATALSRMQALKEKGVVRQAQPSFTSAAYLDAIKSAMQIQQQQEPETVATKYESPKTRYNRILAERTMLPPTISESPIITPAHEDIPYSPVRFVSPRIGDRKIDLAEPLEEYEFDLTAFENLNELEELGEFEEPSLIDVSQYPHSESQYMPLTPPQTPPPSPSAIISRARQQYEQQAAICQESSPLTPYALEFPEDLPEEELFELSAPSFEKSPSKSETPIRSPNITIPRYFEETPPPEKVVTPVSKSISLRRSKSPAADVADEEINIASPPLLGVCPGVRVKTPQGPILIPPHPKDPTDVAAMIRRAQLIQKLRAKEAAEKAATAKEVKVRQPISRRIAAKPVPKKGRLMRRLVLKKKQPDTKEKIVASASPRECPAEPPELPAEYLAEVAKARILAGLKNKTALLNQKVAARQALSRAEASLSSVPDKVTPPPPDYATIMKRVAGLRAAKAKIQQGPTARELANRQNIINRQQRRERKRLLHELERLRQQQGFDRSIEFEPKTPPPVRERLRAIKSRIPTETATSVYPYSPVKTPEVVDIPHHQPFVLPQTPPYQYLENVCIPNIEDMSMQFDDFSHYNMDYEIEDADDIEFQLAEAEAANAVYSEFDENNNIEELEAAQAKGSEEVQCDFDMAERIKMLQQQLLESPNKAPLSQDEYNMAERMELLQKQLLQTPTNVADAQEEYDMVKRIEMLQKQFLQTPTTHQTSVQEASRGYVCIDESQLDKEAEQYDQQDYYDEMMDDFEAMERECN